MVNPIVQIIEGAAQNPDIPILGKATLRLSELNENTSTIPQIVEIILSDPSLSQKILRTAQSAPFLKWGGGSNNNQTSLLTSAVLSLGLNQIQSIAVALNLINSSQDKKFNQEEVQYFLFKALCASFAARDLSYFKKLNSESNAIRALFYNSAPIFCLLYHEPTFRQIEKIMDSEKITFDNAFKKVTGSTTFFLIDRLLKNWNISEYIRNPLTSENPDKEIIIKTTEVAHNFIHLNEPDFLKNLNQNFDKDFQQYKSILLQGLERGKMISKYCGIDPLPYKKEKETKNRIDNNVNKKTEIFIGNHENKKTEPIDNVKSEIQQLSIQIINQTIYASDNLSNHKTLITNAVLEKLRNIFEMEWALCAYGSNLSNFQLLSYQGATLKWAQNFVTQRQRQKMDIFLHSIHNGNDIYMDSIKSIRSPLPPELAPDQFDPQSFTFIPMSFRGKVRGYILLSSAAASTRISDEDYALIKGLINQLTVCFQALGA